MRALVIDPQAPTRIYAGTGGGGVFKSINERDWDTIVERAMALSDATRRGAVILGHCTHALRGALSALIACLRERGFAPKTLTAVLRSSAIDSRAPNRRIGRPMQCV